MKLPLRRRKPAPEAAEPPRASPATPVLQEHVLAGLERLDRPLRVQVVGKRVIDGVNGRVFQEGLVRHERSAAPALGRLGRFFLGPGSDPDQLSARGSQQAGYQRLADPRG